MWAMIPMLRTRSRGWVRFASAIAVSSLQGTTGPFGPVVRVRGDRVRLPAVVGVGLVGLRHLVHVFAALHRSADAVGRIEQLVREALGHRLLTALPRVADHPT